MARDSTVGSGCSPGAQGGHFSFKALQQQVLWRAEGIGRGRWGPLSCFVHLCVALAAQAALCLHRSDRSLDVCHTPPEESQTQNPVIPGSFPRCFSISPPYVLEASGPRAPGRVHRGAPWAVCVRSESDPSLSLFVFLHTYTQLGMRQLSTSI